MAQSNYSDTFYATVGPRPIWPTDLPNGYTDDHLWVRCRVGTNPTHQWVGPIENTDNGIGLCRTFAARKMSGYRSDRKAGRFNSVSLSCDFGKRYWQVYAHQWKVVPIDRVTPGSYREGLRRGDGRFGVMEQRANKTGETDLNGAYGGYFPEDYPTGPVSIPPVYAARYSIRSGDVIGHYNSEEHTDFFGPLNGVNSLVSSHYVLPSQDNRDQITGQGWDTSLNAYYAVPPSVIPAGFIPMGIEVQIRQYNSYGWVMTRADGLYGSTSHQKFQQGTVYPIDDPRSIVHYTDPITNNVISLAKVNGDTDITGPPLATIPPEMQPGTLAGAFDYSFSWFDVWYRYRVHYMTAKGEVVSEWQEDAGATRGCKYLRGPYEYLERNPMPFSFSDPVPADNQDCPQVNHHPRYYTCKAALPIPAGATGIDYFLRQTCGGSNPGLTGIGKSYKILGTDATGVTAIPYYPIIPGDPGESVSLNAVPVWDTDPTQMPNGASWSKWQFRVSWNYIPRSRLTPESLRISPQPMYLTTQNNNPYEACPGFTNSCVFNEPPTDHVITTHSVRLANFHYIPLWIQAHDAPEPTYNTSSAYRFTLEDGTVCYYRLGDQGGGPALPGKGIIGYGLATPGANGEIFYSLPVYIGGPLNFPTDIDTTIPPENTAPIPSFHTIPLDAPDPPIGFAVVGNPDLNADPATYDVIIYKSVQSYLATVTS